MKQEKYHRSELEDPENPYKPSAMTGPCGDKWQFEAGGDSTPPAKRFANRKDLVHMLTPKSRKPVALQSLFSPPGKLTPASADICENTLEI